DRFNGSRSFGTAIYFLIKSNSPSHFHLLQADEIWHFYTGSPVTIFTIDPKGNLTENKLGNNPDNGEAFQFTVKAGDWFAAAVNHPDSFALVGCTMAPGFDFNDFILGRRNELTEIFPEHQTL